MIGTWLGKKVHIVQHGVPNGPNQQVGRDPWRRIWRGKAPDAGAGEASVDRAVECRRVLSDAGKLSLGLNPRELSVRPPAWGWQSMRCLPPAEIRSKPQSGGVLARHGVGDLQSRPQMLGEKQAYGEGDAGEETT
jgi:hypothetical protein